MTKIWKQSTLTLSVYTAPPFLANKPSWCNYFLHLNTVFVPKKNHQIKKGL